MVFQSHVCIENLRIFEICNKINNFIAVHLGKQSPSITYKKWESIVSKPILVGI